MQQSARSMIVLGAVLLICPSDICPCSAQTPCAPSTSRPGPSPVRDFAVTQQSTRIESVDLRHPIDFGALFQSPDQPGAPAAVNASTMLRPGLNTTQVRDQSVPLPAPRVRRTTVPPPRQLEPPSRATAPMPGQVSELAPTPDDLPFTLKAAPLEPTDFRFPINLATALRLSDARPLIVAAAQASVWVAEAQLTRAKVLWVPQLNVGGDYIRHDGGGPDFNKGIMTAPSVNFFYGGGGLVGDCLADRCLLRAPGPRGRCSPLDKPTSSPPKTTPHS